MFRIIAFIWQWSYLQIVFSLEVQATERKAAYETYEPHQQAVKDSVAFGRALSRNSDDHQQKQNRCDSANMPRTPKNFVDKVLF